MKILFFTIFFLLTNISSLKAEIIEPCGKNASLLILNDQFQSVLLSSNSNKIIYPASLVKMMTAYIVFEELAKNSLNFNDEIIFSLRAQEISEINQINTLKIKALDKISVENALETMIVKSYNESAVALAEKISGDEWSFVRTMNKKALELGMINTSFRNSSGLHEDGQYTTAEDLAKLAWHLKNDFPQYYYFFGKEKINVNNKTLLSHNNHLKKYNGADGIKTGYTQMSGYNIVTSALNNKNRVYVVVTGCKSAKIRDNLAEFLMDLGFHENYFNYNLHLKKLTLKSYNEIY